MFPSAADNGDFDACVWRKFPPASELPKWSIPYDLCSCAWRPRDSINNCSLCDPEDVIFVAHEDCWSASQHVSMSAKQWAIFAYKTRPITLWRSAKAEAKGLRSLITSGSCLYSNTNTDLGRLLADISRRPQELVDNIMIQSNGTAVNSLFKAGRLVQEVLPRLHLAISSKEPKEKTIAQQGDSITSLYVTQTDILGETYISEIGFNGKDPSLSIPLAGNQPIRGLQCAVSRFGLRAVRVLYSHMSPSPWLGEPSHSWMGTISGTDLCQLRVIFDVREQ